LRGSCREADEKRKEIGMSASESVAIVLEAFKAVEERDDERLLELYHPERELHWPPSLPFGGSSRAGVKDRPGPGWGEVWERFQPTEAEQRVDPRVVAATEKEVVVLWHQRAVSPSGERFDGEVLGLYEVRDGKLARAQMFYFDAIAVQRFLAGAEADAGHPTGEAAVTV
jgi:ketosteroid isomerase-like protein